jgi:hypothetical protein
MSERLEADDADETAARTLADREAVARAASQSEALASA